MDNRTSHDPGTEPTAAGVQAGLPDGPVDLSRRVRFCVPLGGIGPDHHGTKHPGTKHPGTKHAGAEQPDRCHNTFAGWPTMHGLGAFYEIEVTCRGLPDPVSGYLANISEIDDAVRTLAIPRVAEAVRGQAETNPALLLRDLAERLQPALGGRVVATRWHLTPFYHLTVERHSMDRVTISQQFSFAAAHRLHSDRLGPEENRSIFGKCNNLNGHGHNYRVEVSASVRLDPEPGAPRLALPDLERIVDERVIRRFDHTHLNRDTVEFVDLVPSVEHIVKVCHDLLAGPIHDAGGHLERVTVWETDKTSCTYPAAGHAR